MGMLRGPEDSMLAHASSAVLTIAVFSTVLLQVSFQVLPAFVRLTSGDLVTLQAFGGLVLLLFWLYLMANVLVLGAEVNWWFRYEHNPDPH